MDSEQWWREPAGLALLLQFWEVGGKEALSISWDTPRLLASLSPGMCPPAGPQPPSPFLLLRFHLCQGLGFCFSPKLHVPIKSVFPVVSGLEG